MSKINTIQPPAPSACLFLDSGEWANLSRRLEDPFFRQLHEDNERAVAIITEAGRDQVFHLPLDLRNPESVLKDQERHRVFKHRIFRFAVSWRLTGNPSSLREALRTVDELLNRRHWDVHNRSCWLNHGDLKTADYWYVATFAREALWPVLGPQRIHALETMLIEWALPAYLRGWEEADWWRHAEFNWGASVHGCAGVAALAMRDKDPDLSEKVLRKVREGLAYVIEAMPIGGGWIEGMMYQATTLGHLTDFVSALHRLTGEDLGLITNRCLQDSFDFRMRMLGGDGRVFNFSNCNEGSPEWTLPHSYWWAARCERPDWAGFEDEHPKPWWDTHGVFLDLEAMWLRNAHQPSVPFQPTEGLAHAREIDWLTWRTGGVWFGFRSGWNGGNHCNFDLGQLIFGIGEERLLCDPGYGAVATSQHNCIAIRGQNQLQDSRARIFRTRELSIGDESFLYLCCDLSATQPAALCYHYRHCIVGGSGILFILDDLMARAGRRVNAKGHLQSRLQPVISDDGVFHFENASSGVRGRFLTPVHVDDITQWESKGLNHHTLSYISASDLPIARPGVLLIKGDPSDAAFECRDTNADLRIGARRFRIDLSEGSCKVVTGGL